MYGNMWADVSAEKLPCTIRTTPTTRTNRDVQPSRHAHRYRSANFTLFAPNFPQPRDTEPRVYGNVLFALSIRVLILERYTKSLATVRHHNICTSVVYLLAAGYLGLCTIVMYTFFRSPIYPSRYTVYSVSSRDKS